MTGVDVRVTMRGVSSQSAFVRGFIDDIRRRLLVPQARVSQSAFVRGFIDDERCRASTRIEGDVSIRVRARLHR